MLPRSTQPIAQQIVTIRDKDNGGALGSFDNLNAVGAPVVQSLQSDFYLSDFGVRNVDIVGPQVGKQLQTQAKLAVLYSLGRNAGIPLVPF